MAVDHIEEVNEKRRDLEGAIEGLLAEYWAIKTERDTLREVLHDPKRPEVIAETFRRLRDCRAEIESLRHQLADRSGEVVRLCKENDHERAMAARARQERDDNARAYDHMSAQFSEALRREQPKPPTIWARCGRCGELTYQHVAPPRPENHCVVDPNIRPPAR